MSACQVFGLPSVFLGRGSVIPLSERLECIPDKDNLRTTERNVQLLQN